MGQQFVGCSLFADRTAAKHHDVVGIADSAHTVGNDDDGLVAHQFGDARLYFRLVLGVKACGGFVEKYDWGILQQGTGNGNALSLATRKGFAVFADNGIVPALDWIPMLGLLVF